MASIFEELMAGSKEITLRETPSLRESIAPSQSIKKINVEKLKVESMKILEEEELGALDQGFATSFDANPEDDADKDSSDEVVLVIDPELPADEDVPEDAAENLIGDKIYKCPVCGANYACDCDGKAVEKNEDGTPKECPVCGDDSEQLLVGEIAPADKDNGENVNQEPVKEESEDDEDKEEDNKKDDEDEKDDGEDNKKEDEEDDKDLKEESLKEGVDDKTEHKKDPWQTMDYLTYKCMRKVIDEKGFDAFDSDEDFVDEVVSCVEAEWEAEWEDADTEEAPKESYIRSLVRQDMNTARQIAFRLADKKGMEKGLKKLRQADADKEAPAEKPNRRPDKDFDWLKKKKEESIKEDDDVEETEVEDTFDFTPEVAPKKDGSAVNVDTDTVNIYFDEKKFESLIAQVIKENYKGSPEFKVRRVSAIKDNLRIDYVVRESKSSITRGSMIAEGFTPKARRFTLKFKDKGVFTESFTRKPIMTVECIRIKNNFIPTGLKYDYKTKVNESLYRVVGSVGTEKHPRKETFSADYGDEYVF